MLLSIVAVSPPAPSPPAPDKPAAATTKAAKRRQTPSVGRHPHRVHPLAAEPALRDSPLLPGRLRRRSRRQGRAGRRSPPRCWARGGSKSRTYAELLDALYPLAAEIQVYSDKESVVFEGTVHRDNLAKFADLLAEQVLTPRFAEDDFARNKAGRARLPDQDAARERRRGARQAGAGHGALQGPSLRPPHAGDGRRAHRHHARRRQEVLRQRTSRASRLIVGVAGGYPDGFAEAFAKRFAALPRQGAAAAQAAARARAQGEPAPDRARRTRAPTPSRSATPSTSPARTPTSIRSPWRGRTSASTAPSTAC